MKKSTELRQELNTLVTSQEALMNKAKEEKRSLNADEGTKFDDLQKEIDEKRAEVRRAEQMEDNLRQRAEKGEGETQMRNRGGNGGENGEHDRLIERYSIHRAINATREGRALDGVEKEIHDETVKRAKEAGVAISGLAVPTAIQKRFAGQSVTQDSGEYGAALVDSDMQPVVDFLRPKPILESIGATYMRGLQGDVKFPVNEGGISAAWEGEVDAGALSKNKYSNKTMKPKRLVAGVPLSIQNIIQSSPDLEAYTLREMNAVFANALDLAAINGTGTGDQPLGILNDANVPVIALGTNGAALTWAQIVAMETGVFVENANVAKMAYAINSKTKGKLKTTKHEAGDLGYLMTASNEINGYPVGVSNLIPGNITKGTGTNLSAAVFGDFSQLIIGQWGFMDLTIDKSTAISGYFTLVMNGFYDVLVRQPKSFVAIKDISNA